MSRMETYWQDLGGLPPEALGEARIQLLHAAVVLGAATEAFIEEGQRRFEYLPDAGALVTAPIDATRPVRLGMSLCALELVALEPEGGFLASYPLPGSTLAASVDWVVGVARDAGIDDGEISLPRPLGIPAHPLASIGTFSEDIAEAAQEIGRYVADAQLLLEELVAEGTAAGPVSVVPADLSLSVVAALDDDGHGPRSIAVGFFPGDEVCEEPFWFVRPSPAPDLSQPPVMAEPGQWRSEGWKGAAMTATDLLERPGPQHAVAEGFVQRALTLCRGLLA